MHAVASSCLRLSRWKMGYVIGAEEFGINWWQILDFRHLETAQESSSWDIQKKKLLLCAPVFLCFGCPPTRRAEDQRPPGSCTFPVTHAPLHEPNCRSTGEKSASSVFRLLPKFLLCCQTRVMTCCQFLREDCNHSVFKQWRYLRLLNAVVLEESALRSYLYDTSTEVPRSKATRDYFPLLKMFTRSRDSSNKSTTGSGSKLFWN